MMITTSLENRETSRDSKIVKEVITEILKILLFLLEYLNIFFYRIPPCVFHVITATNVFIQIFLIVYFKLETFL